MPFFQSQTLIRPYAFSATNYLRFQSRSVAKLQIKFTDAQKRWLKTLDPICAESKVAAKPLERDVANKGKQAKASFTSTDNAQRLAELRDFAQYVKTNEERMNKEERDECE